MYPPNLAIKWVDTDTPENAQYEKDITYTFNEYGFRADSFHELNEVKLLCAGCSITVGVGVDDSETWPRLLGNMVSDHIEKPVSVLNIATSGASPDYVTRSVWRMEHAIHPTHIFVYWPPISRLELPHPSDPGKIVQTAIGDEGFPKMLIDEDYLVYAFRRNLYFLEGYYRQRRRHFFSNPVVQTMVQHQMQEENPLIMDKDARDGMHPGPDWHKRAAEFYFQMYINKTTTAPE